MSDAKLAEKCRLYKQASTQKETLGSEIMDELNRRGVNVGDEPLEPLKSKHGVTLRKVARTLRYYNVPLLRELLKPKHRSLVIYEAVRVSQLDELVDAGLYSHDAVKGCLDSSPQSEPYLGIWLSRT